MSLENIEATTHDTPTVDTTHELKWKRTVRRHAINILALIENDGKPTTQMNYQIRKLHEAFTCWNSDVATWVKHRLVLPTTQPVPQTELQKPVVDPIKSD